MNTGRRIFVLATVSALFLAFATDSAWATTFGGMTTAKLSALTMAAGPGAPAVVAWENFDGVTGTNLNGTTTDGGAKTWSVNPAGGSWTIQTNAAKSTSKNTSLVIDAGAFSDSAVVTVFRNSATTFDAGLTVNRNAAGTELLTAEWTSNSNGSLELWKYNGSWTSLAAVTNLYPGGIATAPASITLKFTTSSTNVLTAHINGTSTVTATLSAADVTTYKNATHQLFGLYQRTSNGISWDDFHLDNP